MVELKITASGQVIKQPFPAHVKQLKAYLAISKNPPYGKLLYLIMGYNSSFTDPFIEYLVTLIEEEREIKHPVDSFRVNTVGVQGTTVRYSSFLVTDLDRSL